MCGRFLLCVDTSYTCQVPRKESGKIGLLSSNKGRGKMIGGMVVDAGVMMTGGTGRAQARKELHSKQKHAVGLEQGCSCAGTRNSKQKRTEGCSRAGVRLEQETANRNIVGNCTASAVP